MMRPMKNHAAGTRTKTRRGVAASKQSNTGRSERAGAPTERRRAGPSGANFGGSLSMGLSAAASPRGSTRGARPRAGRRRPARGGARRGPQALPCSITTFMASWPAVSASRRACSCLLHWPSSFSMSARAWSNSAFQLSKAASASGTVSKTPSRYLKPKASMASDLYSLSAIPQGCLKETSSTAGICSRSARNSSSSGGIFLPDFSSNTLQISFITSALVLYRSFD
mmetsp:Transcript_54541/g.152208  ORF Transcript_54541/g.152208 Transcript_54541/m.152208 type:complete len:226 (-) Transcript_54541:892-1569(-)